MHASPRTLPAVARGPGRGKATLVAVANPVKTSLAWSLPNDPEPSPQTTKQAIFKKANTMYVVFRGTGSKLEWNTSEHLYCLHGLPTCLG
jgi:hypothetical protein